MIWKTAVRGLSRNWRRSFAIGLTVALGSASVFMFNGFNEGVMNQYRANTIRALYGYGQINTAGYRNQVYENPSEHWMEGAGLLDRVLKIPGVNAVFPRVQFFQVLLSSFHQVQLCRHDVGECQRWRKVLGISWLDLQPTVRNRVLSQY